MQELVEKLSALLAEKHMTLSTAESCTGGLIAKSMTDRAGASAVFCGGVVSYVNAVKRGALGVEPQLLDTHGAVSEPVARAMAAGCRKLCGSDVAVSVTGVAGPDRDDRGNAVGTVFIGVSGPNGTRVDECHFTGDRQSVREQSAAHALAMALRAIE